MYVAIQEWEEMAMDPNKKAQIKAQSGAQSGVQSRGQSRAQVGALIFNEALTEIPAKYSDYSDIFLAKNITILPENTKMNKHAIELEKGK